MRDDLMTMKVEIDPMIGAPSLWATQQFAIKAARRAKVVDGEGKMERR